VGNRRRYAILAFFSFFEVFHFLWGAERLATVAIHPKSSYLEAEMSRRRP
jgi:hypothetical protein